MNNLALGETTAILAFLDEYLQRKGRESTDRVISMLIERSLRERSDSMYTTAFASD